MDWDDLRYFLAAYRRGSLSAAARELGCEYTTVGRRIVALETALGTKLFTRGMEGLNATAAATDLVPLAEQIERTTVAIAARVAAQDERVEGVVRVTCAEGFSLYLVDRFPELRERYPKLGIEVLTDVRPLDLHRGEADVALRLGSATQGELVTRKLCAMPWRMFASPAYLARRGNPSPIGDLSGHDIVAYDAPLEHVPGARWLDEHADGANVVFRGNSLRAIVDAAVAGLGLTVLPHFLATRSSGLSLLAPDVLGTRTLSIVIHPDLVRVARVRAVIDFLAEAVLRDHAAGVFG
ncbi:MAG TPA: LysR family transcriptional regulator [Polyangiaceae bacterium]|nr:LysR family transcriptional regulator [Polyangiaceae bacterium]